MDRTHLINQKTAVRHQIERLQRELTALYVSQEEQNSSENQPVKKQKVKRQEVGWLAKWLKWPWIVRYWDRQGKEGLNVARAQKQIQHLEAQVERLMAEEYQLRNAIDRSG